MGLIASALAFLETAEVVNYAEAARIFNVDRTILSRRHRGVIRGKEQFIQESKLLMLKQ
ncbi:hypothetical protein EV356DRAFT_177287 [Viridothelium virens]|uniref:HTH psq-type domain-containing protein n=1 Tax=Viridothelium virens TaxID=1048519 RepID=A0A6A6H8M8_VIRVR|nr:hypothetical protein EV356DRAFT_177287 [Viridothelium virens]